MKKIIMVLGLLVMLCGGSYEILAGEMDIDFEEEYPICIYEGDDGIYLNFDLKMKSKIKIEIYDAQTSYIDYDAMYADENLDIDDANTANFMVCDSSKNELFLDIENHNEDITNYEFKRKKVLKPNESKKEIIEIVPYGENTLYLKSDLFYDYEEQEYITFNIKVTVLEEYPKVAATKIKMTKRLTITKGYSKSIKTQLVNKEDEFLKGLSWKSSNKKIATVDSNGKVTAVGKGKCKITCTLSNGKKYTCDVTVKDNIFYGKKMSQCDAWDYNYGKVILELSKVYYKKDKLVVECIAINNRVFKAVKYNDIELALYNSDGKKIVEKKFKNVKLNLSSYGKKKLIFEFPKKNMKIKKVNLGAETSMNIDYGYVYTYQY